MTKGKFLNGKHKIGFLGLLATLLLPFELGSKRHLFNSQVERCVTG